MKHSLLVEKDGKILFTSDMKGLRPLVECIAAVKENDCTLHDKVVGLAAARLIVYSGLFKSVAAGTISKQALAYLEEKKIKVSFMELSPKILNADKTDVCPMEKKSMRIQDDAEFAREIRQIFYSTSV